MITIENLRQFRFGQYAIFDFIVSFLGIYLLSPWLSKVFLKFKLDVPTESWLLLVLPLSILIHLFVGNTPMTSNFLSTDSHYVLKAVILVLLFLGLKDIKIIK